MNEQPLVLVVDDQSTQRLLSSAALKRGQFDVIQAGCGEEALRCFQDHEIAAILLDVMMPDLNGFEVCRRVRALPNGRDVPIMMATARDDDEAIRNAFDAGATDFINKPVNASILCHRMRYILRSAKTAAELRDSDAAIRKLAYFDALTGLPNRPRFAEQIDQCVAAAQCAGTGLALLHIDMDSFKRINDLATRDVGDMILTRIAERITRALRDSGLGLRSSAPLDETAANLARLGGDEFGVLLDDADEQATLTLCAHLLEMLREPYQLDGRRYALSACIGIARFPTDGLDSDALLRNADAAMREAKRTGINRCERYADEIHQRIIERLSIEHDLRGALEREEFEVFYQPKINISLGQVIGMEALVRWISNGKVVSPAKFIPVAEETDLIEEIGSFVLQRACKQAVGFSKLGLPGLELAVNLSARQLERKTLPAEVSRVLSQSSMDPSQLCLEVTESALMRHHERSARILSELREIGCKIAIDDFGTGYSSLSYLNRFPVDCLKVDQSFVRELGENPESGTIVTAIVRLAQTLGLSVVAEGVETSVQERWLRAVGCHEIQGYLYSRPLPAAEFEAWLVERVAVATVLRA